MSSKLVGLVYDGFPTGGSEFDVLLALADITNEDTGRCDPGVSYISWKTRQSERTVQYALKSLGAKGWIKAKKCAGAYGTNLYILNRRKMESAAVSRKAEYDEAQKNKKSKRIVWDEEFGVSTTVDGVQELQVQELHRCKDGVERVQKNPSGVQSDAVGGATDCTLTREPEINQKQPSTISANAEEPDFDGTVRGVHAYYCKQTSRSPSQYTLTERRLKKAVLRLKERTAVVGFADAKREIKLAIDNLVASDYHMSNGYIDWEDQIFKSAEEFEKRVNWKPSNGHSQKSVEKGKQLNDTASGFAEIRRELGIENQGEVLTPRGFLG